MLSAESLKQIDIELAKYPADQRRSAIMGALRIAQTEKGWLAPETIAFVADYIGISPAQRPTKSLLSTICTTSSLSANTN